MEESYLLPQGLNGPPALDPTRLQGVSNSLKAACSPKSAGVGLAGPGGTFPGNVKSHRVPGSYPPRAGVLTGPATGLTPVTHVAHCCPLPPDCHRRSLLLPSSPGELLLWDQGQCHLESWGLPRCKVNLLPIPWGRERLVVGGFDSVPHSLTPSGNLPLQKHHLTNRKEGLTLLWLPAFWALPS